MQMFWILINQQLVICQTTFPLSLLENGKMHSYVHSRCFVNIALGCGEGQNVWKWCGVFQQSFYDEGKLVALASICIVFTNEKLCCFGIKQSPLCTFCQEEDKYLCLLRLKTTKLVVVFSPLMSSAEQREKNLWYPG